MAIDRAMPPAGFTVGEGRIEMRAWNCSPRNAVALTISKTSAQAA